MKNSCIIFLLSFIIILAAIFGIQGPAQTQTANTEYLRIHVRANSNLENDQAVKYIVRDGIVEYLTPVVAECRSKGCAEREIVKRLDEISALASKILSENGYTYQAKASVREETFPTRVYEDLTLQAGVYDALIVELGSGEGDNWWCVIYPPLCFSGGNLTAGNIVYKSKIAEIIQAWKEKK
jgi:stage II sporulation protein R